MSEAKEKPREPRVWCLVGYYPETGRLAHELVLPPKLALGLLAGESFPLSDEQLAWLSDRLNVGINSEADGLAYFLETVSMTDPPLMRRGKRP